MELDGLAYHSHRWVVETATYDESEELRDFFHILATDEDQGHEFVVAVEGKHYPVTGVMFHPETQPRHSVSKTGEPDGSIIGKVNNEVTDEINYLFSEHVRKQAEKTLDTHKFEDPEFGKRMEWLNSEIGFTRGGPESYLVAFGF